MDLAIPQVDVVKDIPDWITFAVGLIGAAGTILAIAISIRAQKDAAKARAAVGKERRRLFDLEILRDLLEDLDESDLLLEPEKVPKRLQRYRHRLLLLPAESLPFWRSMMAVKTVADLPAVVGMMDRIAEVDSRAEAERQRINAALGLWMPTPELERYQRDAAQLRLELGQEIRKRIVADLETAIRERVEAVDD